MESTTTLLKDNKTAIMKHTLQTLCFPVLLFLLAVSGTTAMDSTIVLGHSPVAQAKHNAQAALEFAFAPSDKASDVAGCKPASAGAHHPAHFWPAVAHRRGMQPLCRAPDSAAPSNLCTPQYAGKASLSTNNTLIPWRSHISCECLSAFKDFAATISIQN